jgi:molybdopterin/thiamine biosynthesis adenylyltransferase
VDGRGIPTFVDVASFSNDVTTLGDAELDEPFAGADLVLAGTDSFAAPAGMNEIAVARRIAAVFVEISQVTELVSAGDTR